MSDQRQQHHQIDYIEISAIDLDQAKKFYHDSFDWDFNDYGPEYAGIKQGDGEAGGLAKVDSVKTGGPLVILYSNSLEASLQRVLDAGGRVTKEIFSFPGGRRFQFLDPSGNELSVWSDQPVSD